MLQDFLGRCHKPCGMKDLNRQLSTEKRAGCLGFLGDYTTHLRGDCNQRFSIVKIGLLLGLGTGS